MSRKGNRSGSIRTGRSHPEMRPALQESYYRPVPSLPDWKAASPGRTARLVKAGSKINFQIHYSKATGKPETDITSVGLTFAKEPPKQVARRIDLSNHMFLIPAGSPDQEVTEFMEEDDDGQNEQKGNRIADEQMPQVIEIIYETIQHPIPLDLGRRPCPNPLRCL